MKKVLVITYYWPPSGGSGVQRWLKFAKYLPQYGIEPVILTVDPRYAAFPQRDPELVKDISHDLKVIYTGSSTGIFTAYKKLTGRKEIPYGGFVNESNPGLLQNFFRFIRGNFFLPDARKGWNRFAYKGALEIIKSEKINTVITTSPPHSTQLTGLKLKKKLKINWIADLRDPWTDIYYTEKIFQTFPARWINRKLESRILNNADLVVATCNATRDVFRSKLTPGLSPEKIITITNGFDPDDFQRGQIIPAKFVITYLGTIAGNYDIDVLARALNHFKKSEQTDITLRFIGKADETVIRNLIEKTGSSVEMISYVNHQKAMEYLADSAALLLVIPSVRKSDEMIPGKLFEYLASKRPVIAIGPAGSDAGEILRLTGAGEIFEKSEDAILGEHIIKLYRNFKKGEFETAPAGINIYSRDNLAQKYSDIIKTFSGQSS